MLQAADSYNEGLLLLDKALSLNVECPSSPDFNWEKACGMMDKMRRTRLVVGTNQSLENLNKLTLVIK